MANMFEALQSKKTELVFRVKKAKEFGWIDENRCKEILGKIDNDVLTIGVIGQMKCGKSTFLNSFVFEDDILPSATTPMTAALSVITYGEKKRIVAEFYNEDEWAEMKAQASRDLSEVAGNTLLESKIKAAKELVAKSSALGSNLSEYLKKGKQEDSFENLIEYVGADGKFVSITKSVSIYYPKEYLKGVEIVDTPGFNDPIVSREERTNAFLKKADVVLMMLYAGRPFDATDRDIIFKNVRQCGVGKVLIGINKYDIPYEKGETEKEIQDYVREELEKACRACNDNLLVEVLENVTPIPISASMALLSEIPMGRISSSEQYSFDWKRYCDIFEISSQPEMRRKSRIDDLFDAVKLMVEKEKDEILFKKPINAIMAAGRKIKEETDNLLRETELRVENLKKPDDELEESRDRLSRANRRLEKKINGLDDDLNGAFKSLVQKGKNELEDIVDASCNRLESVIKNWPRLKSVDSITPELQKETQQLISRDLKRAIERLGQSAERTTKNTIRDFMTDAEEVLMKFLPEVDSEEVIRGISSSVDLSIEDADLFKFGSHEGDDDDITFWSVAGTLIESFIQGYTFGAYGVVKNAFTHDETQRELLAHVNELRQMDLTDYLDSVFGKKDNLITQIKDALITSLIHPMQAQVEEILANTQKREDDLKEAEQALEGLKQKVKRIASQFDEIKMGA